MNRWISVILLTQLAGCSAEAKTKPANNLVETIKAKIHRRFFPAFRFYGQQIGMSSDRILSEWGATLQALDDDAESATELALEMKPKAKVLQKSRGWENGGWGKAEADIVADFLPEEASFTNPKAWDRIWRDRDPEEEQFNEKAWNWLTHNDDGSKNDLGKFQETMQEKGKRLKEKVNNSIFPDFSDQQLPSLKQQNPNAGGKQ